MRLEGTRAFAAPQEAVWRALIDPRRLAAAIRAVEHVDVEDERRFRATVRLPLGPAGLRLHLDFERVEEQPPAQARLRARGGRFGARLSIDTSFALEQADDGTLMRWVVDVDAGGPVLSLGERALRPIAERQVDKVLAAVEQEAEQP